MNIVINWLPKHTTISMNNSLHNEDFEEFEDGGELSDEELLESPKCMLEYSLM